MATAREVMTAGVRCMRPGDTVLEAARTLAEIGVGSLPICGENGKLKGMLTDRDIVVKVVAAQHDPSAVQAGELVEGMPVVVDADDDVTTVLRAMTLHRVRRVLVLDGKALVGVITQADIARRVGNEQARLVASAISESER
ncbi:CBS domain-containing protein [Nocardia sp. CA2R105]|uniref:CBS domain-containing protein n=1 Tax=Nocardia coffeae TaxID=2873381 RepID=UPI001CA663EB|nr:CBS domain-containing protein [Nocardia coffeae]MBY8860414.1 CBS domain-containing protein [Nocardia coffeae]